MKKKKIQKLINETVEHLVEQHLSTRRVGLRYPIADFHYDESEFPDSCADELASFRPIPLSERPMFDPLAGP